MADLHITASCIIRDGYVYKHGELLFEQNGIAVDGFLSAIYKHLGLNYPKFYKMDNLSKLGFLASEVLLKGFNKDLYTPEKVGIILSNASSSLDADIKYWDSAKGVASPALFVYTLPNIVIGEICIRNGFKGEHAFYITPEFDARFIYQQIKYLFDNAIVEAAICGWAEILGENYNTALFLVQKEKSRVIFSAVELASQVINMGSM